MSLSVRPATPDDVATLAQFNVDMALETEQLALDPATVHRGVARLIDAPQRGFYRVAEHGGCVVGSLMVTSEWSDWRDGDMWWIQSVFVAPEARRMGVFRALYTHVLDAAKRDADVRCVRLYVEKENRSAQATYARLGMLETAYRVYEIGA
ncbi:MAG: GNAT family N-acetyltransferase [Pseudomonadota bacterium]